MSSNFVHKFTLLDDATLEAGQTLIREVQNRNRETLTSNKIEVTEIFKTELTRWKNLKHQ